MLAFALRDHGNDNPLPVALSSLDEHADLAVANLYTILSSLSLRCRYCLDLLNPARRVHRLGSLYRLKRVLRVPPLRAIPG
jgi:hypothetical protein